MNAPLTGANAEAPGYHDRAPLVFYRPGECKRKLIGDLKQRDRNQGVQHGIYITDWDGAGKDSILTASFSGIDLFQLGKDGKWNRTEISKGDPAPWPKGGSDS
ncbi:MAG: hypothetical protein M3Z23_12930 [Acidobacteriota bacterium]|nr:hypothetical protein [Acidobacteriota bacterium]